MSQPNPYPGTSPEPTERDALGRLFQRSQRLRQADHYRAFLDFIARLSHYSPFNSALLHVQRPGAMYFATERQWRGRFGRHVKPGARPCVILQPFGPILFVFAAKDTEPGDDGTALPERITEPFAVDGTLETATWRRAGLHSLSERYLCRHISGEAAAGGADAGVPVHAAHTDAGSSDVDRSDADQPSAPSGERDTDLLPPVGIETVLKAVTYIEDMGTSGFESKRDIN